MTDVANERNNGESQINKFLNKFYPIQKALRDAQEAYVFE